MDFSSTAFLVSLLLAWVCIFYSRTLKTPAPFPLPVFGHLHLIAKTPLHRTLAKLSQKYGPVLYLRYGCHKVLLLSSSSAVEEYLKPNDVAFSNFPQFIAGEHLGYNNTMLFSSSYGDHWRNLRRCIASEITSHRLEFFSGARSDEIRSLLLRISAISDGKDFHQVQLGAMLFELMLNTMLRIVAGKHVVKSEQAQGFRQQAKETMYLLGAANIADFLPFLRRLDLQGLEKRSIKSHRNQDSFMQKIVDKQRAMSKKEREGDKNMIDMLLSRQETDPEYYTDEIIKGIMVTMLVGGTDSLTATVEWALSLLLNHPEFLTKARDEMDRQVGQERLLEESDLPTLTFLHSIIYETLRLYPGGPVSNRQASTDCTMGNIHVGNIHVTKGTILQINIWAIHRDPDVWTEPTKFNPGRFEGMPGKEGFKWMPFGSGRRRCPGEFIAVRMVGLALGSLIQCFEWKRLGEDMVDMTEGAGLTLPRAKPLVAMCKPRPIMKCITHNL